MLMQSYRCSFHPVRSCIVLRENSPAGWPPHAASFGRRAESVMPLLVPKKKAPLPSRYFALAQVPRVPGTDKHGNAPCPKQVKLALPLRFLPASALLARVLVLWSLPLDLSELTQVRHSLLPFDHLRSWRTANESCRVQTGAGPAAQIWENLVFPLTCLFSDLVDVDGVRCVRIDLLTISRRPLADPGCLPVGSITSPLG